MRNIRLLATFVVALAAALTTAAAEKLELRDITGGAFRPEAMSAVQALADGESWSQLTDDNRRVVKYSFKTGRPTGTLFDVATAKGEQLSDIDGYTVSPDGRYLLVQTATAHIYRHSFTANYYVYSIADGTLQPLSANGAQQTPLFSPDGRHVALVRDNNIFMTTIGDASSELQVTFDGQRNAVINGIPDWVNEEEFSLSRAMAFSADGTQLVWVRYDESAVKEYSMQLFKGLKPERQELAQYPGFYTYKYPIAGETNATVTVWAYDIARHQVCQLPVPVDADGYIPRLKATADPKQVAVYTLNRHQDCLRIYMCNPETAQCRQVIEEQTSQYIREQILDGVQIGSRHILVPSDRTGWMHLYLYDLNGCLLRQIDDGQYDVSTVYGYDESTGDTYFASHERGATEQQVYVAHADGSRQCLTEADGWSTATFSSDFRYFVHTWSDLQTPPVYTLRDRKGRALTTLIDNQALRSKLAGYGLGRRELLQLTTADGVTLNAWMVTPPDFDASRQYPVIMYQYGGPGNQQVRNAWGVGIERQGAILEQLLCQRGYVCLCVDNRGTGGRGADFEKCTYLKLGQLEARDQAQAACWIASQPWADAARIAIWGWSFGGFNTLMAMSEGSFPFRCGVAIAPPTSWRYYDTIYTERFMRTPQENPDGYDDCPISRAGSLKGALLLCHGMADDNVHFRNTAEYTEALVQADKDFRQLVYTNRNHSIFGGNTRCHLFRQCLDFFDRELAR